jgi:hypothetical protein
MIPIVNIYKGKPCYLHLDEDLYCEICNNNKYHIDGYFLFSILNEGLRLIGDISQGPVTSIDLNSRRKLIIYGVDEL